MAASKRSSETQGRAESRAADEARQTGSSGRVTIGDVAAAAGVARPTVSAILNDRPHCYASKATRKRVQDAAERLGYRPTPIARALLGKSTKTLGVVTSGFDVEITALRLTGFEVAARKDKQVTIILSTDNVPELEDNAIRSLIDRYVDGIAIYPCEHGPHTELRKLVERRFPVVTFDGMGRLDFETDDITPDSYEAGRLQAKHLIEIGRSRIGLLSAAETCYVNERKVAGFCDALAEAGLELVDHVRIAMPEQTHKHWLVDDFEQIHTVLEQRIGEFDALATLGDLQAMAVIRVATELGVRIPDDLAVIGVDNSAAASQGAIPLSTVGYDAEHVGIEAFNLLSKRVAAAKKPKKHERIVPPWVLYPRVSTVGRAAR